MKTKAELEAQGHTGPIYAVGDPVPAKSQRRSRTKGKRLCNCKVLDVIPSKVEGQPVTLRLLHPTSKARRVREIIATPEILRALMPGILDMQIAQLCGYR